MTRQEIIERVNDIVINRLDGEDFDPTAIKETAYLESDLGTDSLDVMEIVMEVEKEFGISIPDDEAGRAKTLGDIYDLVEKKLK